MGFIINKARELYSFRYLIYNLVARELKIKYKGSILGFFWSLLNPLLKLIVYTIAFQYILQIRVENFAVFFLCGYLPWTFLQGSLSMGVSSLTDSSNLIKKIFFPREVLPLSVVLFNLIQFLLTFLILIPALFYFRLSIGMALLTLPALIILQFLFITGCTFVFSALNVFFRDTKHFLEILLEVWFWVSPIVYPLSLIPQHFRTIYLLNPVTAFVEGYRTILLENKIPSQDIFLNLLAAGFFVFAIGYAVFEYRSRQFAEEV